MVISFFYIKVIAKSVLQMTNEIFKPCNNAVIIVESLPLITERALIIIDCRRLLQKKLEQKL